MDLFSVDVYMNAGRVSSFTIIHRLLACIIIKGALRGTPVLKNVYGTSSIFLLGTSCVCTCNPNQNADSTSSLHDARGKAGLNLERTLSDGHTEPDESVCYKAIPGLHLRTMMTTPTPAPRRERLLRPIVQEGHRDKSKENADGITHTDPGHVPILQFDLRDFLFEQITAAWRPVLGGTSTTYLRSAPGAHRVITAPFPVFLIRSPWPLPQSWHPSRTLDENVHNLNANLEPKPKNPGPTWTTKRPRARGTLPLVGLQRSKPRTRYTIHDARYMRVRSNAIGNAIRIVRSPG
ncbi:hypothetical protein EVG20_g9575 [Dentipellis fragilis]|uniref:Uncharacterized protein n=1 Tax=Dentipellis fragilis TaxID=205917 RepID=A0A4Y9XZK1_9AGAM|nr:hypothetical protein EVG20_g9575 [Dentipellis fragilis]